METDTRMGTGMGREIKITSPLDARVTLAALELAHHRCAVLAGMDEGDFSRTIHGKLRFTETRRRHIEQAIRAVAAEADARRAVGPMISRL